MGQCTPVGSSRVGLFLTLQMPRWPLDFEQRGSRGQGAEAVSIAARRGSVYNVTVLGEWGISPEGVWHRG